MGNKAVKQHFETAQKTGVLKISQMRLHEFPPHFKQFPNVLRTLDISENRFVVLPEDIGKFTLLKHLNVSGNRLITIPALIGNMIKLETLNAKDNLLETIDVQLQSLRNLKQVFLSNNQLTQFPVMFCGLKHLDLLDLSKNKITAVPPNIKELYATELNLNQNQITSLAEELSECPKLKTLRLEENCLQITELHPKILHQSIISNLTLEGNLFNSKQFTEVDGYDEYMERYTAVKKKMF